ncbi:MAG: DUF2934 domain-containing protein [Opitutus sp.]
MKTNSPYAAPEPTEAEIQHAAYLLWLENGRPEGQDLSHWLAAKQLLCHRHAAAPNPRRRPTRASTQLTSTGKN